jgi:hypothetical protein
VQRRLGLELGAEAEVAELQVHAPARLRIEGDQDVLRFQIYRPNTQQKRSNLFLNTRSKLNHKQKERKRVFTSVADALVVAKHHAFQHARNDLLGPLLWHTVRVLVEELKQISAA